MKYIDVFWHHRIDSEPTRLISEIDENRREVRKVEFFFDGSVGFASESYSSSKTILGTVPLPSISDINSDNQFEAKEIDEQTFETYWNEYALKA